MKGYVNIHKIGDRQIFANGTKFRIYARLHGFISEGFFCQGQAALDATFALWTALDPPYIDYILDTRFSDRFPQDVFQIWKEKALEIASKYPRVYMVVVTKDDSPLWLQLSEWKEFFEQHGNRILGKFDTPEEADEFLDKYRNIKST
jgi:hypothetical protein